MQNSKRDQLETIALGKDITFGFQSRTFQYSNFRDVVAEISRSPMSAILNAENQVSVLRGLNFEIKKGDRIGLLGVNGAGKTTLCRCIAGLYRPQGTIEKFGHHVRAIFDTAMGIHPELTGRENAKLLLKFMYPTCPDAHPEMLQEICNFSELQQYLNIPFKNYSNGMQARLCLSLISAMPADLLILDEVFDGADQFFRKKIAVRIQNLIASSGAVIFISHSEEQTLQVCNRVWLLQGGKIIFDGAPEAGLKLYKEQGEIQSPGAHF